MKTILIVDDNRVTSEALVRLLAFNGIIAERVGTGEEAIEYLSQHTPELILLDLMLPDIDGLAVLGIIRSEPHLNNIHVIMYTGTTDAEAKRLAIELGVDDYWIKGSVDITTMEQAFAGRLAQAA